MSPGFLSHVAYSVGAARPIDALRKRENLSRDAVAAFRRRGLRGYREDARSVPQMCVASALQTLSLAGLEPAQVSSLLIASSNADAITADDDETALFSTLYEAGFQRARILGLTLQACSACGDALRLAAALAGSQAAAQPVLVIIFGQKKKTSRLGPQANLVFSDGAASCLVCADAGTFEICASESMTNTQLASMGREGSVAQFHGGLLELRDITRKVCGYARVQPEQIRSLLGTNAGTGHLELMAEAAGIPLDRTYCDDVPHYSHVHSCDNLISLKNLSARGTLIPGDLLLLLSWSPHVVSACVLRYRG